MKKAVPIPYYLKIFYDVFGAMVKDILFGSFETFKFIKENFIALFFFSLFTLMYTVERGACFILELLVCTFETVCTTVLAGRGLQIVILVLCSIFLLNGDLTPLLFVDENIISNVMKGFVEFIGSGRLRRCLYRRSKLCIFKHNFVFCNMIESDDEVRTSGVIDSDDGGVCKIPKKRKTTSASLGNKKMGPRKKQLVKQVEPFTLTMNELIQISAKLNECCTCSSKDYDGGCLFSCCDGGNFSSTHEVIVKCRAKFANLNDDEAAVRKGEIFRGILPEQFDRKHVYCNYNIEGIKVCRDVFLEAYGLTTYQLKKFLKQVKESKSQFVNMSSQSKYSDRTVHDFSWNELEQKVYGENVLDSVTGALTD